MKAIRTTALVIIFMFSLQQSLWACDACKKQQPEILQDITHGAGPQSNWDYVIISITVVIVSVSLFLSAKYLIRPAEKNNNHIKRLILD
jgi:hypothetical protein